MVKQEQGTERDMAAPALEDQWEGKPWTDPS